LLSVCRIAHRHGCGFLLWNTSTKLPSGEPYSYHVPDELNVLQIFSDAMEEAGIGHGFYCTLSLDPVPLPLSCSFCLVHAQLRISRMSTL